LDGDILNVEAVLDRFENRVQITGAVYREGMYEINGKVNTVKELINKAEGIRGDAFLDRAQLQREHEDLTLELIPIDLQGIINGTLADIPLKRNDILYIPSIHDLKEKATLKIHGQVAHPGTYVYADKMTIEDLIIQAGGLLESASIVHADISRRIKKPSATDNMSIRGKVFRVEIKDGFAINGGQRLYLEPFDEIYIRKSPAYFAQQNVSVVGEVMFGGIYSLEIKNEKLKDLIDKAGGTTKDAYIKGARLTRKMTDEEIRRRNDALRMSKTAQDSISLATLEVSDRYSVGIDLAEAINNPESEANLVLREGDELFIPEYVSTVKINGAVMYPNTVLYKPGEGLKYYISQAGGYGNLAKKNKAYVVYMNGTVAKLNRNTAKKIEPGCEIIIPMKDEKKKLSTAEIISVSSSVASFAAIIATLVNLFK